MFSSSECNRGLGLLLNNFRPSLNKMRRAVQFAHRNLEALREIIVPTPTGAQVPLGQLAKIEVVHAPMGVKSEAAVPNAWIYVDVKGMDIGTYVELAMRAGNEAGGRGAIKLRNGYNIFWGGVYGYI